MDDMGTGYLEYFSMKEKSFSSQIYIRPFSWTTRVFLGLSSGYHELLPGRLDWETASDTCQSYFRLNVKEQIQENTKKRINSTNFVI